MKPTDNSAITVVAAPSGESYRVRVDRVKLEVYHVYIDVESNSGRYVNVRNWYATAYDTCEAMRNARAVALYFAESAGTVDPQRQKTSD